MDVLLRPAYRRRLYRGRVGLFCCTGDFHACPEQARRSRFLRQDLLQPLSRPSGRHHGRRAVVLRQIPSPFDVGDFDRGIGRTGVVVLSGDRKAIQGRLTCRSVAGDRQFACTAGTLISVGRMITATITSRQSAPKACSMVTKPPCSYSQATRPTEAPAAVKPMK